MCSTITFYQLHPIHYSFIDRLSLPKSCVLLFLSINFTLYTTCLLIACLFLNLMCITLSFYQLYLVHYLFIDRMPLPNPYVLLFVSINFILYTTCLFIACLFLNLISTTISIYQLYPIQYLFIDHMPLPKCYV